MWVNGKWIKVLRDLKCSHCNSIFNATDSRTKYCSQICKNNHNNQKYAARHHNTLKQYLKRLTANKPELSWKDLYSLYEKQQGLCALSGEKLTWIMGEGPQHTNISMDRIQTGGHYTLDNIRLVCHICNIMRHTLTDEALYMWCDKIIENLSFSRTSGSKLKSQTSKRERKKK